MKVDLIQFKAYKSFQKLAEIKLTLMQFKHLESLKSLHTKNA
jgi:hypothetical protein